MVFVIVTQSGPVTSAIFLLAQAFTTSLVVEEGSATVLHMNVHARVAGLEKDVNFQIARVGLIALSVATAMRRMIHHSVLTVLKAGWE